MKKALCMVTLAAMSFGSVFAHGNFKPATQTMQTDTIKKVKKKPGKMKTKKRTVKKDTTMATPAK